MCLWVSVLTGTSLLLIQMGGILLGLRTICGTVIVIPSSSNETVQSAEGAPSALVIKDS